MNSEASPSFTAREIAKALGVSRLTISRRASRENWPYIEESARGHPRRCYPLGGFPVEVQAAVARAEAAPAESPDPSFKYDARTLWKWWLTRSDAQREIGRFRAGVTERRIRDWHYGAKGNPGARLYAPEDRPAALVPSCRP